jgi:hypothetical protein
VIGLFFQLKKDSISRRLNQEFASSPFGDGIIIEKKRLEFKFGEAGLQTIFNDELNHLNLYFSPNVKIDQDIIKKLMTLIEHLRSEDDKLLTVCEHILHLKKGHIPSDFFSLLIEYCSDITQNIRCQLSKIQLVIKPNSEHCSSRGLLVDALYAEKLRLKQLYLYKEFVEPREPNSSPIFLHFPFSIQNPKCIHIPSLLPIYSTSCKMVTVSDHLQTTFSILSEEFRLAHLGSPIISLPFNSVYFLTNFRPYYLEIFTTGCHSYLLYFAAPDFPPVSDMIASHSLQIHTNPQLFQTEVLHLWASNRLISFDLILALNILTGRSFNDPSFYPIMPLVRENYPLLSINPNAVFAIVSSWLPLLDKTILSYETLFLQDFGYIIPQAYFAFSAFPSESHRQIYYNRCAFECDSRLADPLRTWITQMFRVRMPIRHTRPRNFASISLSLPHHEVAVAGFSDRSIETFFICTPNGVIESFTLTIGLQSSIASDMSLMTSLPNSSAFCVWDSHFLIVDVGLFQIPPSKPMNHSCRIVRIAPMGDEVVYVIDGNLIAISNGRRFPGGRRIIVCETDFIEEICTNVRFGVIVYATKRGKIGIVSVQTRRMLGMVEDVGETVQKLLVTNGWGFLIVKTENRIQTFSLSGVGFSSLDFMRRIVHWTAFTSRGVDVVVIMDESLQLCMFEAFRLETMESMGRMQKTVVAMGAGSIWDVLILITADGKVRLRPLPPLKYGS